MRPPRIKMKTSSFILYVAVLLLTSITRVDAFWRLLCHGTLGTARIDPIVSHGEISGHAHMIAGASNFGFFSDTADLMASNCTSCEVTEDKSAYWTPALYFQHDNGSYELVPTAGGMTVYYFNDNVGFVNDTNGNLVPAMQLTAFPPDFRMIAGNTSLRNFPYPTPDTPMSNWNASDMTQESLTAKAIGFNCLNYTSGFATEGALEYHYLRNKTYLDANCLDGVRFELEFPSCWDGVRLDSEDHKSHILYPNLIKTGACPDGFNVRTPVMFFETIWQTYNFVNESGTFVIANGDLEGYGYHGDFYSGWNQSFLQNAVNTCTNGSGLLQDCGLFTLQNDSISTSCFLDMPPELEQEDCQSPGTTLPGNVPIVPSPGPAPELKGTSVTGPSSKPPAPTALLSDSTFASDSSGSTAPTAAAASVPSNTPAQAAAPSTPTYTPAQASATSIPTIAFPAPPSGSTTASPAAITTSAPGTNDSDLLIILSTSTYFSDGHEVHMVIYEDVVTVTDSVGAAKRRVHKHAHAHAHGHD